MNNYTLTPPVAFLIVLASVTIFSMLLSKLAFKKKGPDGEGGKSYACGEDIQCHLVQPDYGQFFPFAFFFTILHVFALVIATIPAITTGSLTIAVIYIVGILAGLSILFRR